MSRSSVRIGSPAPVRKPIKQPADCFVGFLFAQKHSPCFPEMRFGLMNIVRNIFTRACLRSKPNCTPAGISPISRALQTIPPRGNPPAQNRPPQSKAASQAFRIHPTKCTAHCPSFQAACPSAPCLGALAGGTFRIPDQNHFLHPFFLSTACQYR